MPFIHEIGPHYELGSIHHLLPRMEKILLGENDSAAGLWYYTDAPPLILWIEDCGTSRKSSQSLTLGPVV